MSYKEEVEQAKKLHDEWFKTCIAENPSTKFIKSYCEHQLAEMKKDPQHYKEAAEPEEIKIGDNQYKFENWGQNLVKIIDKSQYLKPANRGQIAEFLKKAYEAHKTNDAVHIRCNSHKHSYTEIFIGDANGFLIDFDPVTEPKFEQERDFKINKDFTDKKNPTNGFVELPVGKTSGDFGLFSMHAPVDERYCLPQDMIAEYFTYPGVTVVGCHSAGFHEKQLSDYVAGLEIMYVANDGTVKVTKFYDGEYYTGQPADDIVVVPHEDFRSFRVSLGLFGVVLTVIMNCKKLFWVQLDHQFPIMKTLFKHNFTEVSDEFKHYVTNHYYTELFWFPFSGWNAGGNIFDKLEYYIHNVWDFITNHHDHTHVQPHWDPLQQDKFYIKTFDVVPDPLNAGTFISDAKSAVFTGITYLWSIFKTGIGAKFMQHVETIDPYATPLLLKTGFPIMEQDAKLNGKIVQWPNAIHYQYGIDYTPVRQMEVCFVIGKADNPNWKVVAEAFGAVVKYVEQEYRKRKYPLDMCCESRFTRGSDTMLANNFVDGGHGTEYLAFYIEVVSRYNNDLWATFAKHIGSEWRRIGKEHNVPCTFHWAKDVPYPFEENEMKAWVKERYGDRVQKFNQVREKYVGKEANLFANPWLKNLLDIKPAAQAQQQQ